MKIKRILTPLLIILLLFSIVVMGAPTYVNVGPTTEFEGDIKIISEIVVEGVTTDEFETTLVFTDPTADRTFTFPDTDQTYDLSLYYLKTAIDTQGELETIWGVTLATDAELAALKFTDLTDTPANYTGQAGKYIKVNAGETDLEFGTPTGAGTYLELTDTPAAYDNGKYAKSTAAGVVWDTPTGGYTNLTSFIDQTAWRLFYSNNLGDVIELALGTDGTYLGSNGATSAPTFKTPSGAGDMLKATYDTDEDGDIDVEAGGTEKSVWTLYAIPYLSGTTAFGEIPIGTAEYALTVNATATGYDFTLFDLSLYYLKTEIDSFSKLQAIIADKTLVNVEDGITATAIQDNLILKADFADEDWGDMTVATNVVTIDSGAVTYAKIQNISATDKILGRSSAGAGVVEEIVCTSAGRALIDDADASAQRATLGIDLSLYYLKTAIDTQGEVETIWGVTLATDAELAALKFTDLTDTPANYTGGSSKFVRVNVGETALEFAEEADPTVDTDAEIKAILVDEVTKTGDFTVGRIAKINNATGIIEMATSTDAQVSDAVTKAHTQNTDTAAGGEWDFGAHSAGFTIQTAVGDGTTTINWTLGNYFKFTHGAMSETFTFDPAPTKPSHLTLIIIQDGTGGRDSTWPVPVKWLGGEPTWTDGGGGKGIVVAMVYDGTSYWAQGTPWEE